MTEDLMSYTMSQGPQLGSKCFRNDTASAVAGVKHLHRDERYSILLACKILLLLLQLKSQL